MADIPDPGRLRRLLDCATERHGGVLPVDAALIWHGYLEALLQWGLLDFDDYEVLTNALPEVPEQPVLEIVALREIDKDLA
jgi:hypothetical protein